MAIIAPYVRWSARDLIGDAAIFGQVFTFENGTRVPKTTYQDAAQKIKNSNPVSLDGKGEANIYWDTDAEFYTIELYDRYGQLILTQDNYPDTGTGSTPPPITIIETPINFVRNPQFFGWNQDPDNLVFTNKTNYSRLGLSESICNDWFFERNNTNANIEIRRNTSGAIPPSSVNGNQLFCLEYECTDIGSGGWFANIYQKYQSVQTLANQQIAFGIQVKNNSAIPIDCKFYIIQNFGTGDNSPSDPTSTLIADSTLESMSGWVKITGFATIPSLSGKTVGNNGDDSTNIQIVFPANTISTLSYTTVQIHISDTLPDFPKNSWDDQLKQLNDISFSYYRTGDIKYSYRRITEPGWLKILSQSTIGSYFSGSDDTGNQYLNLFCLIWEDFDDDSAPIYHPDGTPGVRTSSAMADWNADKRISLPPLGGGNVIAASGGGFLPGQTEGTREVTLTINQIPPHHHEIDNFGKVFGLGMESPLTPDAYNSDPFNTQDTGGGDAHPNMQPTVYYNAYIKL